MTARISLFVTAAVLLFAASAVAQPTGAVEGGVIVITQTGEESVDSAMVSLDYVRGNEIEGPHLVTYSDEFGAFAFSELIFGAYSVTASKQGLGFSSTIVTVFEDQTTHVTLALHSPDTTQGPDPEFEIVELAGTAMVEPANEEHEADWYFIDVDGNEVADYRLAFGPPWYESPTEAERPQDGDHIEIVGGLMSYGDPPIVVVYVINGLAWRPAGHGGHAGQRAETFGCDPEAIAWVELTGTASVFGYASLTFNAINVDYDEEPEFILDYGDDYAPAEGMIPEVGQEINIVGGMLDCDYSDFPGMLPWVIVYEINGTFWRVPGDTTGLGLIPGFVFADVPTPVTVSDYLMAESYPNPFNPVTTISYATPVAGQVRITVFDLAGREVATLVDAQQPAGSYSTVWDGSSHPSGFYFYRVSVNEVSATGRMLLLK